MCPERREALPEGKPQTLLCSAVAQERNHTKAEGSREQQQWQCTGLHQQKQQTYPQVPTLFKEKLHTCLCERSYTPSLQVR